MNIHICIHIYTHMCTYYIYTHMCTYICIEASWIGIYQLAYINLNMYEYVLQSNMNMCCNLI